jgi:hypothetical protein
VSAYGRSCTAALVLIGFMWHASRNPTKVVVTPSKSGKVVEEHYRGAEQVDTVERSARDTDGGKYTYFVDEDTHMPAAILATLLACSTWLVRTRGARSYAGALAGLTDLRAAGPLTLALEGPDRDLRDSASQELYQLLPRFKTQDSLLLTAADCNRLYGVLRSNNRRDTGLILAILRMVQQTGDLRALQAVEALARRQMRGDSDHRVWEAARQCLLVLQQESAEDARTFLRRSLLRPTDPPTDPLLRPAAGAAPVPEVLLRTAGEE